MPNDERDDVTEEGTSEEPEEELEPEAEEELEPEAEEEETPSRAVEVPEAGGGCSGGVWAVIVIILAVLIALGAWSVKKNAEREAAKEADQRQQTREGQLRKAAEGIADAETALQRGDVGEVVSALEGIAEKLQIMRQAASQQGDAAAADEIGRMRTTIDGTIGDINEGYAELEEVAKSGVASVRVALSQYAPPAPAEPTGEEEVEEGEVVEEEAVEEEAAEEEAAEEEAAEEQPAEEGEEEAAPEEEEAEQAPDEAALEAEQGEAVEAEGMIEEPPGE